MLEHDALMRLNDRLVVATAQLVEALRRSAADADRQVSDSRLVIEQSLTVLAGLTVLAKP